MGWAERRQPAPVTRADLAHELADALGLEIGGRPGDAEAAWPELIAHTRRLRDAAESVSTTVGHALAPDEFVAVDLAGGRRLTLRPKGAEECTPGRVYLEQVSADWLKMDSLSHPAPGR